MTYAVSNPATRFASNGRPNQRGFSLVEIMVSLAIGLVVVGAVFANYLNNNAGNKQAAAMAQVTQDASLAMGILRNHIAMAGYSRPVGVSSSGTMSHVVGLKAIVGCDGGFAAATANDPDYSNLTCNTTGTSDDIAVSYEADTDSMTTVKSGSSTTPVPADCTGAGLMQAADASGNSYYVADNRFTITPATANTAPALACNGNGNVRPNTALTGGNQPLVENIAEMHIRYGIDGSPTPGKNVTQYVTATQIANNFTNDWTRVISVRICLIVRSEAEVLPQATPYYDCSGNVVTPADRRLYRAFKSTVVLNNNIAS